ncbi:MAG: PfkB family carbohydrate kinase [Bacteroides sp.]|nr:PfkB family carbohydrate kinase [Eubacterium sp.]MCM1419513.1 PfkB family carbohydrate kinase [Roseburia sp.]MCM1463262.1 PfkB family carbohydrate kinase [Bacteroides sp.]
MIFTTLTCACADIFNGTGEIFPGGESLNFSCAVKAVSPETEVFLVGAVGDDEAGHIVRATAERCGVNTDHLYTEAGKTASNRTYLTPDGDRYYRPDSWDSGVYGTFRLGERDRSLLRRSDLVHTSIYCPSFGEILTERESGGFRLAVDFNDSRVFTEWEGFLDRVDLFFISGDEAVCRVAREWSERYAGVFIVTLGERGSRAFRSGAAFSEAAVSVERVVDTTGCGDSYQAGFCAELFRSGDLSRAMKAGALAAARVVGRFGGVGG